MENPLGQTFGIIWMIWAIIAFSQKKDRNVMISLCVTNVFWVIHFFLMWLYTGMLMATIGIIRLYLSLRFNRNLKIFFGISILTVIVAFVTYQDSSSLFPMTASILASYAFFFLQGVRLRMVLLLASSFWLSYNFVHFSIWWMINESILHIVHLITIYRIVSEKWSVFWYFKSKLNIDYGRYLAIIDFRKINQLLRKKMKQKK
jgi:hypothetical protein